MTILPYQDRAYVRFISDRTGETLFEIKMLDGAIVIWGARYRPSEFGASLAADGATVSVTGTLRDRIGPVVIFGEQFSIVADFRVESGCLPLDYDASWSRDHT